MAKEKLHNLLKYDDFSKEITKKPKPTKRTSVAKDVLNENKKINNFKDFREYVYSVLTSAMGNKFDVDIADEMIEDLKTRVENGEIDWGEAVGIVQTSLGKE